MLDVETLERFNFARTERISTATEGAAEDNDKTRFRKGGKSSVFVPRHDFNVFNILIFRSKYKYLQNVSV